MWGGLPFGQRSVLRGCWAVCEDSSDDNGVQHELCENRQNNGKGLISNHQTTL